MRANESGLVLGCLGRPEARSLLGLKNFAGHYNAYKFSRTHRVDWIIRADDDTFFVRRAGFVS